jgi:hypothetical protein
MPSSALKPICGNAIDLLTIFIEQTRLYTVRDKVKIKPENEIRSLFCLAKIPGKHGSTALLRN